MREKFRQFMIGRYGTDGLNQFLSIASIVLLLISLLTRFSLFTWLGLVLLVLCYYRSLSRNISKRTEENYQYYALKDRVDRKFRGIIYRNCIKIFFVVLTEVQTYFLNTGKDQKSICI